MNAESTKYHLINPVLATKGYDDPWKIRLETPPPVEPTGFKGRRGKSNGRTDDLIYVRHASLPKPWPVGVLEAKPEDVQPMDHHRLATHQFGQRRHVVFAAAVVATTLIVTALALAGRPLAGHRRGG